MTTALEAGLLARSLVAALYAGTVASHTALQRRFASQHGRRAAVPERRDRPQVDVIVPILNEAPDLLEACCESLLAQDYQPIEVFLVDDGSDNFDALEPLYQRYGRLPGWTFVARDRRVGKRNAQDAAFQLGRGEFVLTIDSDTVIYPDTIQKLVNEAIDKRVGAVTGNVRALNPGASRLAWLVNWRYALLFDQERAAHARFQAVLCCTGPLSLYRRTAIEEIWEDYLRQTFMRRVCVFGDDLHLTNLLLARGYEARYAPKAKALTEVPTRLGRYFRQQVRWHRSFYRELHWTFRALRGHRQGAKASAYLWFDVLARGLMPLLLAGGLLLGVADGLLDRSWLLADAAMLGVMTTTSAALAFWQTRNLDLPDRPPSWRDGVRLVLLYGLVHLGLLVAARVWALLTLRKNAWGTRQAPAGSLAPSLCAQGVAG